MSSTPTFTGGDFLGYRAEELVGQGGMGAVYRARDLRLKRTVALKLMGPELAADEPFRARFAREAELAMALEHPNVVPIHDAGEVDGQLYLVMRFVEGTDLRVLLREEGALPPRRALAIVSQIANALDAAHANGLVHRDVKPSNVLLDRNEHAYLADFGLTRRVAEDGAQFTGARSLGTPAYLAPEQIDGRPVDGRADVYSLGCLLYECLAGEPPFVGPSRLAVAWAHLEEEPPNASERNAELPDAIDDVLRKAMAKEPEDRYATCPELAAAAEAALGLGRRAGRLRRALLIAAAIIATAVLVAALVARAGADEASPLAVGPNKLIRVDPKTNKVSAVIDVGKFPSGLATSGQTVWVYNLADRSVSEIDARTNDLVQTTSVSSLPMESWTGVSPSIVADADGAWVIGRREEDGSDVLTRVLASGRGKHEHRVDAELVAVAVAAGTVWLLGRDERSDLIIRVDQRTGAVTRTMRMPDGSEGAGVSAAERRATSGRLDGLAVGGGFVWASAAGAATLYRVDPATGAVRLRDLGGSSLRPVFGFGHLWMCVDGAMKRIDPKTLREARTGTDLGGEREYVPGYGSMWRHDVSSETLMRFHPRTGDLAALTPLRSLRHEVVVTSIATGAGGVWVAVARF